MKAPAGEDDGNYDTDEEMEVDTDYSWSVSVPMQFEQLTRELEVKVYKGLPSTETFKFLLNYLSVKARSMQYWRGWKQTTKETPQPPPFGLAIGFVKGRPGPERKLRLEQELLLTLMKLRLAPLTLDLGFRFMFLLPLPVVFSSFGSSLCPRNCQL